MLVNFCNSKRDKYICTSKVKTAGFDTENGPFV